jgi:hypothetical protein
VIATTTLLKVDQKGHGSTKKLLTCLPFDSFREEGGYLGACRMEIKLRHNVEIIGMQEEVKRRWLGRATMIADVHLYYLAAVYYTPTQSWNNDSEDLTGNEEDADYKYLSRSATTEAPLDSLIVND